ncbi:MAG TPA: hypothetical protein VMB73_00950 [Acetobacteraceae bacterium]|jgi:hypothetical protein|nr:hypothetical protein [Acetobacteraceae bacterium]
MAEPLTADDFAPFVGNTFQAAGQPQVLTLDRIDRPAPAVWPAGLRVPFSLILRGRWGDVLPEGYYRFIVDGRQEFDLYITPIDTRSNDYQEYQIAFN